MRFPNPPLQMSLFGKTASTGSFDLQQVHLKSFSTRLNKKGNLLSELPLWLPYPFFKNE
jgi:hypothetical protein